MNTASNLNYKVLKEILNVFEIDMVEFEKYESNLNTLVNIRNAIAHGENSIVLDSKKMEEKMECVTKMIDLLLVKQVEYMENEKYLKD